VSTRQSVVSPDGLCTMASCMYVSCLHALDAETQHAAADRKEAHPPDEPVDSGDDDFTKLFFPGSIVYARELIERSVGVDDLQHLHLQAVLMCARGDAFEKLTVSLLRRIDPTYDLLQILYGPWADQLTPAVCNYIELDADALLQFGIHKKNVRDLAWPLSRWVALFGVDRRFMATLRINALHEYFPDLHRDMRRLHGNQRGVGNTVADHTAGAQHLDTQITQAIFEIEL
jgi:hypothetical protein